MDNPNLQPKKSHAGMIAVIIVFIVLICAVIIFYVWDPAELFCKKPQKTCKKPGDCCGEDSKCYGSKCCLELNNSCSNSSDCCNKNICDDKDKKCVKPPLSPPGPSPSPGPSPTPSPTPSPPPPPHILNCEPNKGQKCPGGIPCPPSGKCPTPNT